MNQAAPVVTIDGPGGSGKGTISRLLAKRLSWHWLDSGAIYRVLALAALNENISLNDVDALVLLANNLDVVFQENGQGEPQVLLKALEVTTDLRTETCGDAASQIATIPAVRKALLARQQAFRQPPGLVADGRDMGTVVFLDAPVKIFLTACLEERVKRRHKQLKEQGFEFSIDALFKEIAARDKRDAERAVAPLQPAEDAEVLDCSYLSIDEVVDKAMALIEKKVGGTHLNVHTDF